MYACMYLCMSVTITIDILRFRWTARNHQKLILIECFRGSNHRQTLGLAHLIIFNELNYIHTYYVNPCSLAHSLQVRRTSKPSEDQGERKLRGSHFPMSTDAQSCIDKWLRNYLSKHV